MKPDEEMRSPEQVLDDHLRESVAGSIDSDLTRNYADDVVMLTGEGVFRGHEGARYLNERLQEALPEANYEYINKIVEGELGFLEWTARSEKALVQDGADSYVIRQGRIVTQTIHYTVEPAEKRSDQEVRRRKPG